MRKLFMFISAFGLVVIGFGSLIFLNGLNFQKGALLTEGIVISTSTSPSISYTTQDGVKRNYVTVSSIRGRHRMSYAGDKMVVYYLVDNPDKVQIGNQKTEGIKAIIFGGIIFLLGIALLFRDLFKEKAGRKLILTGTKIEAEIVGVKCNKNTKIMGKSPYTINCRWVDSLNNTERTFTSKVIWFDPAQYIAERNHLDIFIDPQNPKVYYMDITFLPKKG
jgi:hypothetical protein